MPRYDPISESNVLSKKEKRIQKSTNFFLIIGLIDLVLLIFKPIRAYHFVNFPNTHFIGVVLLFVIVFFRINQAMNEGKNPEMEASRAWRPGHDMMGAYDFIGPGPDYSNKKYNIMYYVGVIISFGLMLISLFKTFS